MFRLPPVLLALALAAQGCIIVTGDTGDPDMRLNLTFDGQSCAAAGVGTVRVTFVSPSVVSPLTVACVDPMFVSIPDLVPGTYRIQIEAFDVSDPSFVVQAATFDVQHTFGGSHEYELNLTDTTEVIAEFTFAGAGKEVNDGMTCKEAGVTTVEYVVDNGAAVRKPCSTNGRDVAILDGVSVGTHDFLLTGYDKDGRALYASLFQGQVINRGTNKLYLNLLAALGSAGDLELNWYFGTEASPMGCDQAGVASVQVVLGAPNGTTVPLTAGASNLQPGQYPCKYGLQDAQHPADGRILKTELSPGVYTIRSMVGYSWTSPPAALYELSNARVYVPAGLRQGFNVTLPPRRP